MKKLLFVLTLSIGLTSIAQELQLEKIMAGYDFIGKNPENITILPNQQAFTYETGGKYYIFNFRSKKNREQSLEERQTYPTYQEVLFNDDKSQAYYIKNKSIYEWNVKDTFPTTIFATTNVISNLQRLNNGDLVFQLDGNLYQFGMGKSSVKQITNFVKAPRSKQTLNAMEQEQIELFDYLADQKKKRDLRKAEMYQYPVKEFAMNGASVSDRTVSPDGKYIFFKMTEQVTIKYTDMPRYVTQSGYTKMQTARPKVGRPDALQTLYVFDVEANEYHEVSMEDLTGIKKAPAYYKDYGRSLDLDEPKMTHIHMPVFAKNGAVYIEFKSLDNKDRWLCTFDFKNHKLIEFNHQHDDAWIGGPGITGWNMVPGTMGWFKDGKRVFFQSEESGYSHLYVYHTDTKKTDQLTSGKFETHGAQLSNDNKYFYLNTNKTDAGNRSFFKFDVTSKNWTPLLQEKGNYEVTLTQDEKTMVYRYSNSNTPWEIYTKATVSAKDPLQITQSQSEEFKKHQWIAPEIVEFKAADGTMIRARKYGNGSNTAAVIFVHGAGYLQNAHNWWSGYYREYMFHNLLVEKGYTVLDIDYRASKGYGRDFRTGIYQHMGGKDLSDHIDGKKYLVDSCDIDADRVGIYGGSYGGFITLMALLTEPGEFACGAAIRSVTDWAHYNHEYTSNILNTPELDSLAFKKSGPIHFAENLKDPLLMLHGLQDDNVQYQDIIRLSQRFIEAGVTNWELATYPIEPHGFKVTSSWVDEYGRILRLFEENLNYAR